jgi:hypothetical protein
VDDFMFEAQEVEEMRHESQLAFPHAIAIHRLAGEDFFFH